MDSLLQLEDGGAGQDGFVFAVKELQLHGDHAIIGDVADAARSVVHDRLQLRSRVFALQTPLRLVANH